MREKKEEKNKRGIKMEKKVRSFCPALTLKNMKEREGEKMKWEKKKVEKKVRFCSVDPEKLCWH